MSVPRVSHETIGRRPANALLADSGGGGLSLRPTARSRQSRALVTEASACEPRKRLNKPPCTRVQLLAAAADDACIARGATAAAGLAR